MNLVKYLIIYHYMTYCHICQPIIMTKCHWGDFMNNNLKLLRKQKRLTQIALQMQTGIEQALLSKFENGERVPPTETLLRLAEFYDVSIDYILCRTDNPKINR